MNYLLILVGALFLLLALWELIKHYKRDDDTVVDRNKTLWNQSSVSSGWLPSWIERATSQVRKGMNESHLEEANVQIQLDEATIQSEAQFESVPSVLKTRRLKNEEELLAQATKTSLAGQLLLIQETRNLHTKELEEIKGKASIAESTLRASLNEGAAGLGMTIADYSGFNHTVALDRARNATEYEKALNEIRAALLYGQEARQTLLMQKEFIFGLFTERKALEGSNDIAKDDKLLFLNDYIHAEVKDFREKLPGLLSDSARQNLSRGDETAHA